jgi:hypothetical protein
MDTKNKNHSTKIDGIHAQAICDLLDVADTIMGVQIDYEKPKTFAFRKKLWALMDEAAKLQTLDKEGV